MRDEVGVGIQVVHFSVAGGRRGAYPLMVLKNDGGIPHSSRVKIWRCWLWGRRAARFRSLASAAGDWTLNPWKIWPLSSGEAATN